VSLKISRLLHAGYIFETEKSKIVFDPIFENPFSHNCFAHPDVQFDVDRIKTLNFDAIFISHFHDDHFSLTSLNLLDKDTPVYMYSLHDEFFRLLTEVGFKNVYSLQMDVSLRCGDFEITPRRALDSEVDSIFQICANGINILNVVDSLIDQKTLAQLVCIGSWDVVLWPFQMMLESDVLSPSRAGIFDFAIYMDTVQQIKMLNPRIVVPSSCQFIHEDWSWYNNKMFPISYTFFKKEIGKYIPNTLVVRMDPGFSIGIDEKEWSCLKQIEWIKPTGDHHADYDYRPNEVVPPLSEAAIKFSPLTDSKKNIVKDYCEQEILKIYASFDSVSEPFFEKERIWNLIVYDSTGDVYNYYYQISCEKIKKLEADKNISDSLRNSVSWQTEILMSKLYSALKNGESLTSLYMRINDRKFSPEIENELQWADFMEDPLVRCLYTGKVATYQKHQLKIIKGDLKSFDQF